jgi:predicted transcriptional regulator
MSKFSEHQREFHELLKDKPGKEIRHINGDWYRDEHGQAIKATTLTQLEARQKFAMINRATEFRNQKRYVNCYHEPIRYITNKLNLNEVGALIKLLPFLRFKQDGLLIREGKPMKMADIAAVIGKKPRMTSTIINRLIDVGIMRMEGVKRGVKYFVNERYHNIGKTVGGAMFTKLYQQETRYRTGMLTIQESGLFYKMIPYFHHQRYYLCANPNSSVEDGEVIDHLTMEDIADLFNESYDVVKRCMRSLVKHGLLMRRDSFKVYTFVINPDVMYRAEYETEYTQEVRNEFAELERISKELQ